MFYLIGNEICLDRLSFPKKYLECIPTLLVVWLYHCLFFSILIRVYFSFPRVVKSCFKTLGKKGLVSLFPITETSNHRHTPDPRA